MQTVIKSQFDAGSPGNLVVLPSFNSAAKVESCRAGAAIFPGDAVKLVDGADSSVVPLADADAATLAYGVAVRAHSNMPAMPSFGDPNKAYGVSANVPQGIVTNGLIMVAVKSGEKPKKGSLAKPAGRNATTGYMEWAVAATGESPFRFDSAVLPGGVAHVMVIEGAPLGKPDAPAVGVTGVTVAPTTANLAAGATQQLTATIAPAGATDKSGVWASSDEAVVTVSTTGLITVKPNAAAAATATVTFTTTDGGKTASCAVTVLVSVTGVTVTPATASVAKGSTQQLTAAVVPANATDKTGAWSSSDDTVATVSATGLVTVKASAASSATVTITFTSTDGKKTASCVVTVS